MMMAHCTCFSSDLIWSICIVGMFVLLLILFLLFAFLMIVMYKKDILKMNLSHEEKMKEDEWRRKLEWEERISKKNDSQKELTDKDKKLSEKDGEILNLKNQLEKITQLDIERIALLVHSLSNSREFWTSEKTTELVDQIKSTQEAIKNYLDLYSK